MKPIAWIDPNDNMSDPFSWNKTSYHTVPLYTAPQCDGCGNCHACLVGVMEHGLPVTMQRMIVCPDCGNKRCPKASNHRHQCTGSNEPNQRGSIYNTPQTKPLNDEEIYALWCEADNTELLPEMRLNDGSINYIITTFAKLIEERHGIK